MSAQEQKRPIVPIYAANSGLEVSGFDKLDKDTGKSVAGAVKIRFFPLEKSKDHQVCYQMEPAEANAIAYQIRKAVNSQEEKLKIHMPPHKFIKDGYEYLTTLTIERYGKPAKFALVASRGKKKISSKDKPVNDRSVNVPMSEENIIYVARFLEHLSIEQAWQISDYSSSSQVPDEKSVTDKSATPHTPAAPVKAAPEKVKKEQKQSPRANESSKTGVAAAADIKRIVDAIKRHKVNLKSFLNYYGIKELDKFPAAQVADALVTIEKYYGATGAR